jgi:predicted acetyltransferase
VDVAQDQLRLIEPNRDFKADYLHMLDEHLQLGEDYYAHEPARKDFGAYLQKLVEESQGLNLPAEVVPMTTYWLVKGNKTILGESRLRHFLTPALEQYGGHIGYVIRPSQRLKGYGTLILALTLEKARQLGIQQARITCDTDNIGSVRIIEKNGGVLAGQVIYEMSGKMISQYWIDLRNRKAR